MKSIGFPPIARKNARILILGSLPGRMSLLQQEYYGQPRNAFWPIMGEIAGAKPELPYAARTVRLMECGIAVWDVCRAGVRPGSLDSAIDMKSVETNDFNGFFRAHPQIRLICLNGAKAADIYLKRILPSLYAEAQAIPRHILPSTSPAHAGMNFDRKLALWQTAINSIERVNS